MPVFKLDPQDAWLLEAYSWHVACTGNKDSLNPPKYVRGWLPDAGKKVMLHHMIVGYPLNGMVVDHINGNGLDNRRCNLQIISQSENVRRGNTKRGTSGVRGVSWNKRDKVWQVTRKLNLKSKNYGNFKSFEQARQKAKEVYYPCQ